MLLLQVTDTFMSFGGPADTNINRPYIAIVMCIHAAEYTWLQFHALQLHMVIV